MTVEMSRERAYTLLADVDYEQPPYGFVLVEGTVSLTENLDELLAPSIAIARRYMGDDRAEEFGRRNAVAGELLVRLHPSKVMGVDNLAD
ncbi:MAG: hypothetical protein M3070_16570 [Actinomycetota bacterium]|nr:hypothetical protein [Actinomycetota bacterium]